ncbi:hypothetical protein LCGC14_2016250 [marine sediment metagenome]|uniref:SGNH hydrolase-type esterase domain-containing protein n=1 Tax=marine sediment metagenome TaxID=412755 RepID=A0A0F9HW19_9ZZZZ
MNRKSLTIVLVGLLAGAGVLSAAEAEVRPVPKKLAPVQRAGDTVVADDWDWPKAMIPVAKKFTGKAGMVLCIGDSITYANQSTRWASSVSGNSKGGYTESDKAILRFSHAYDGRKETNGWWMAAVDRPGGRSETAASGIRTDQYIKGGFHNLPSLAKILKKFNPQVVFILLGTNDAGRRKAPDVLKDMNTIIETILNNGTIPVLQTLPPARSKRKHADIKAYNGLYLALAKARKIPVIDLYGEMVSRQPGGKWQGTLVGGDGVHLTHKLSSGPASKENLANCGYLLRCWLSVQKLKQVKAKVIDKARKAR